MKLTLRVMAVFVLVVGAGFGIAFGAGVAYGRGSPKTVSGGLTTAQLQSMLGIS